ncbi:MAG: aldo/keto reductase [Clostridia bacterium]|nr:aldo/keto reductase [Clostridia bacterium]
MKYNILGHSGIKVSELCFGILPMGPLQVELTVEDGGRLLLSAIEQGVTFFDSAQMYGSYPHLRYALDRTDQEVVITGKSTAATYADMHKAVEEALSALNRDYLDIFLLHAARVGPDVITKREGAWQCLLEMKQKGRLRSVGVSTHNVAAVRALAKVPELDIIFCIYNKTGMGLLEGGPADMLAAAQDAAGRGKGVYSMKLLAGGNLLSSIDEAIAFGRREPCFAAHAVGMVHPRELEMNLRFFNDMPVCLDEITAIKSDKRWQLMQMLCKGCGNCLKGCASDALVMFEGKPRVIEKDCILCGYCAAECQEFAIRVR